MVIEARQVVGSGGVQRAGGDDVVGRSAWSDVVAQRKLETDEILKKTTATRDTPTRCRDRAGRYRDLDGTMLRSYNRQSNFASVVLPAPFCPTMAE